MVAFNLEKTFYQSFIYTPLGPRSKIMGRNLFAASSAIVAPLSVNAANFRAENRAIVNQVENGFATPSRMSSNDAWCAAADYARSVLSAGLDKRIYVRKPKARGVGTIFSLTTPLGTKDVSANTISGKLKTLSASLSIGIAYQFCLDRKIANELCPKVGDGSHQAAF